MTVEVIAVPCLSDNYAWIIRDADAGTTAVVDIPDAAPVRDALAVRKWDLTHIMITHHHADHIAGVEALAQETGARVFGAAQDATRLPHLTDLVQPGDRITIGALQAEVINAPGHTIGHIAYHFPDQGLLFSGDSLMSWGCGRLFEGTAEQMFATLRHLSALPPETLVYSGHEYTEANGRFALSLEPVEPAIVARMTKVRALRAKGEATLPTALAEELATNPFLRADAASLRAALGLPDDASPVQVFTEARLRKDRF